MKYILLLLLFSINVFAQETGAPNTVLRTPAAGGKARMGSVDLSASGAVGSSVLGITNGGTNSSSALTAGSVLFSSGTAVTQDNTNLFWNDASNILQLGSTASFKIGTTFEFNTLDSLSRTQIWNHGTSSILRLGSSQADGDATDVATEGISAYGGNIGAIQNSTNVGYARVKHNRFGLYSLTAAGGDGYYFRVDPTSLYLTDNSIVKTFEVARTTGNAYTTGTLGVGIAAPNASAILDVTSTTKGTLDPRMTAAQRNAIGTPATGLRVYNTDSGKFNYYNGSAWTEVGSGSSGANYIVDNDGSAIGAWVVYKDAAASSPVDGTGGSPTVTYAISTSSTMRGTSNFLFTHAASNQQGEGFSIPFTIDPSDKGKVLQISLEYLIASGTYADDDLQFWIYDVTNAALIQPAPFKLKNSGIIEKFAMEFQTSSNSTSYRLIAMVTTTVSTAYTIRFDTWNLGPQAKLYGSPITDWVSYTPVSSWTTGVSAPTGKWRRNGSMMDITVFQSCTGAPTSADLTFSIPSGYTIDTDKMASSVGRTSFGTALILDSGTRFFMGAAIYATTTVIYVVNTEAGNTGLVNQANPMTFAVNDTVEVTFSVPILGWSSSQVMSSDAATNVVAASMTNTAGTSVGSLAVIPFANTSFDTAGGWNGTDTYTVKVPGKYKVSSALNYTYGAYTAANYISIGIYKNGSTLVAFSSQGANATASNYAGSVISGEVDCIAGDTLQIKARNDGSRTLETTAGYNTLNIERISGPAQIAASETVSALYTGAPPTGTLTTAFNTTTFGTKVKDSNGLYASGTAAINSSGVYDIDSQVGITGTYALNVLTKISIFINGTEKYTKSDYSGGVITAAYPAISVKSIPLLSGDLVTIRVYSGATGPAFTSNAQDNYFSIVRSGNF